MSDVYRVGPQEFKLFPQLCQAGRSSSPPGPGPILLLETPVSMYVADEAVCGAASLPGASMH